jgi:hypothetical protein
VLLWLPFFINVTSVFVVAVITTVMVAGVASKFLLPLVTKLADIPVVIFATIVTNIINIHWLLCLCEHTRSVLLFGYFLR